MSIQVNLISRYRKKSLQTGLLQKGLIAIFFGFFALFVSNAIYITYKIYSLNSKINSVTIESLNISSEIRLNNEKVNRYVLTNSILNTANSRFGRTS